MGERPKRITSDRFHRELVAAGVVRGDEAIRRIVIVAEAGDSVRMYVERFGDDRLVEVLKHTEGIEVRETTRHD